MGSDEKMELEIASKEEMKQQAVQIMKILKLHENVINDFVKENKLNKSETINGILYWLDDEEQQMVEEYEKRCNVLVYHVIKTYTIDDGVIYDLLYITNEKDSWEGIVKRLKQDSIILSHTICYFSENGDIQIQSRNGGVVRIF